MIPHKRENIIHRIETLENMQQKILPIEDYYGNTEIRALFISNIEIGGVYEVAIKHQFPRGKWILCKYNIWDSNYTLWI